jgi:pyruvate/2-oxoglutarate dehydrogenase complex dihydrolipoamide acyltransferase (E2) component
LKRHFLNLTALAAGLLIATATAHAQTAQPAAKPAAKAAKPAAKPAAKAPAKQAAPAEAPLAKADGEQLNAAGMAHVGNYACEFNQTVNVSATPKSEGYVDLHFKSQTWTMKPVLSSTGALRLEDVKGRMLMLQIANKSMLMDTKLGQRVVDDCVHEKQRAASNATRS